MPFTSQLRHRNPFVPRDDLVDRLKDVELLLSTIKELNIHTRTKKKMLNHALWLVAELSGNFAPRYRSEGVLNNIGQRIQRDHIFERRLLVLEILSENPNYASIVERSACCLVTAEEHLLLNIVPEGVTGFDRYKRAGIVIRDML